MTLTAQQSRNKTWFESETTENLIKIIRTAMEEGCISPYRVCCAVDEALCRLQKLANGQRNCDVFRTREETDKAYDKYVKWNMYDHLRRNDNQASCLDYEDWFLADYDPKFYQHQTSY